MAYDEHLARRIRESTAPHGAAVEKPMFGGLGFLLDGHLAVCAGHAGDLLVRVAAADLDDLLVDGAVEPMTMAGRRSRTWARVAASAVEDDDVLDRWVARGVASARAQPLER
ncbi:MAG: RNA methyltransferase [Actinobacteria bacterium]|uniref:Unannotated protein n=1 Tax=freshwater metagenome TaxID=449393 RepID=A0A6J6PU43_9ZZZZ|nr:RNA methyltransferase [Actinomycetota bacterium]